MLGVSGQCKSVALIAINSISVVVPIRMVFANPVIICIDMQHKLPIDWNKKQISYFSFSTIRIPNRMLNTISRLCRRMP